MSPLPALGVDRRRRNGYATRADLEHLEEKIGTKLGAVAGEVNALKTDVAVLKDREER